MVTAHNDDDDVGKYIEPPSPGPPTPDMPKPILVNKTVHPTRVKSSATSACLYTASELTASDVHLFLNRYHQIRLPRGWTCGPDFSLSVIHQLRASAWWCVRMCVCARACLCVYFPWQRSRPLIISSAREQCLPDEDLEKRKPTTWHRFW